jgi:formylmethanofuran dehydrogenase subunit E
MICGRTTEELLRDIKNFHGYVAPGLVIGAFMVDVAYRYLEKNIEADVIVETKHCLPDAIQIFSPCTVGNGWLKILDLDKFAAAFYDRHTHAGLRIWLDLRKAESHPYIYRWFMGLVSRKDLPAEVLVNAILEAGSDILSQAPIQVTQHARREKKGTVKVCNVCHEAYSVLQGDSCLACQGLGYYKNAVNA